jgi:hypothetical protein
MSAELELAVEAEVVEPLDQAAASRIDQRVRLLVGTINDNIVKLRELVDKAKRGHVHVKTVHLFQVEHRDRAPAWTARRYSRNVSRNSPSLRSRLMVPTPTPTTPTIARDISSPDSQLTSSRRWSRSSWTSTVKTSST